MERDPLDGLDKPGLLAMVVAARSDPHRHEQARRAWRRLVATEHERVRTLVGLFRFPGHPDVRVPGDHIDDVSQEVFARLLVMLDGFHGASIPQLSAAVNTATRFTCMDWCRRQLRHDLRTGGSVDDDQVDTAVADQLQRQATADQNARVNAREQLAIIAHALDQLPSDAHREVIRLTALGYESHEIAQRLGLSRENVNQLRSRARQRMREHCDD